MTGLLVVDKPAGITSHDVVARVRRALATRKVGHAGTLDPMATGVLVLGVGSATRLLGYLTLHDKVYRATVRLGQSTVTDDREGDVVSVATADQLAQATDAEVAAAFARQVGAIEQRPSAVSAIKVDGRRAYERVRAGEDVELPARSVVISRIDIEGIRRVPDAIDIDVEVECSSGTYIRAIARDVGQALGVGGHLTALRRTRVGDFTLADAIRLDHLDADTSLISLDDAGRRCFPAWHLDAQQAGDVSHGRRIEWTAGDVTGTVAAFGPDGHLLALAHADGNLARYDAVLAAPSPSG